MRSASRNLGLQPRMVLPGVIEPHLLRGDVRLGGSQLLGADGVAGSPSRLLTRRSSTGRSPRLLTVSDGTDPDSLTSAMTTWSPASASVSQSGSSADGTRSGTTVTEPAWTGSPSVRMDSAAQIGATSAHVAMVTSSVMWGAPRTRTGRAAWTIVSATCDSEGAGQR
jgi:hypothetical protein